MNVDNRTLFIADNLDIMRGIDSETIDLIYLDPPFNTNKQYKAPIGSPAEGAEFKDIWEDEDIKYEWHGEIAETNEDLYQIIQASELVYNKSMRIYLTAMAVRLFEMRRLLKPTGSVYLHCDPTASHYLKLVMDSLFGNQNFRNEVIWCYHTGGATKKHFPKKHEVLLLYGKNAKQSYHDAPRGIPYRDFYAYDKNGNIEVAKGYHPEGKMVPDWWEISAISSRAKERTGWPTQKPLALLDRIIKASSNENDVVLDPFCGCATACVAAEKLQRQWIGIDVAPAAERFTKDRLESASEQGQLFSPIQMSDITVTSSPPTRTDDLFVATQRPLPAYQNHKHELYGIQEGHCNGCKLHFRLRNLTVDHVIAQSKGGTDHIENLQLLCQACNSTKGTGTQEELIQKLKAQGVL